MRVIAGSARRLMLRTVEGDKTRPTTDRIKETLFNILMPEVPGCFFLDLFAGSGGIGIEALSRGAAHAVFVDRENACAEVIRENLRFTHLADKAAVYRMDAVGALSRIRVDRPFDIVFLDPPYESGAERQVLSVLAQEHTRMLAEDAMVIVEAKEDTDFSYVDQMGFVVTREKVYKTNKHVFLEYEG